MSILHFGLSAQQYLFCSVHVVTEQHQDFPALFVEGHFQFSDGFFSGIPPRYFARPAAPSHIRRPSARVRAQRAQAFCRNNCRIASGLGSCMRFQGVGRSATGIDSQARSGHGCRNRRDSRGIQVSRCTAATGSRTCRITDTGIAKHRRHAGSAHIGRDSRLCGSQIGTRRRVSGSVPGSLGESSSDAPGQRTAIFTARSLVGIAVPGRIRNKLSGLSSCSHISLLCRDGWT